MSLNKSRHGNENASNKIFLIEKGKRSILRIIFGRTGIVLGLLLTQVVMLILIVKSLENFIPYTVVTLFIFSIFMVLYVINADHNTSFKLSWIVLILLLPGFGGMMYIFIQTDIGHRTIKNRIKVIVKETQSEFTKQEGLMERLKIENKGL